MNPAALLARFALRLPFGNRVTPRPAAAPLPPRRKARASVAWFAAFLVSLHLLAFIVIDLSGANLRDPEYGRRLVHLKQRQAEHPHRPLVLVVGSSRASMGVRPDSWEAVRPGRPDDPLIFNMSLVGSGPLMELMCLRRLYADGIRPHSVILEYWPPFLREDAQYYEPARIDHARLSGVDRSLVREYWDDPADVERKMLRDRINPLFETRHRLLSQLLPRWQPWDKRMEMAWGTLDRWGWLAGLDDTHPVNIAMRPVRVQHCEKIYRPQFQNFTIHPMADRAMRESVALARSHGAKVAFVWMPEASEFRSWMPADVEQLAQRHLAGLRQELGIPLIDARFWMPDGDLVDGFHLSQRGAADFTKRFGPAVAATLGSGP
jgi:hypothetical protein